MCTQQSTNELHFIDLKINREYYVARNDLSSPMGGKISNGGTFVAQLQSEGRPSAVTSS